MGRVRVWVTAVTAPNPVHRDDAVWALRWNGKTGRLILDAGTALGVVGWMMREPTPPILGPLSVAERGLVAAALAGVIRSGRLSGAAVSLQPPPNLLTEWTRLQFSFDSVAFKGTFCLDVPPEWIPPAPPDAMVETLLAGGVALTARIVCGRATLSATTLIAAARGDVLSFAESDATTQASGAGPEGWRVEVACGDFRAPARLRRDGRVEVTGEALNVGRATTEPALRRYEAEEDEAIPMRGEVMTSKEVESMLLSSVPVEVVAELGRFALRADELVGLRTGIVLPIGALRADLVELRVGERVWARGELVDLDGDLGVRVTEIAERAGAGRSGAEGVVPSTDADASRTEEPA